MKSTLEGYCTWLTWPQVQFSSQAWIVGLETKYIANLSWTPLNRLWMKLLAFVRTYSELIQYHSSTGKEDEARLLLTSTASWWGRGKSRTICLGSGWGPLGGNLTYDPVRLLLTKKVFMPWTTISIREINANIKFFKLEMIIQKNN